MIGTSNISHAASSVAQHKKGRVQDLGRGSCSKSLLQSPGSVGLSRTTDTSVPSLMLKALSGEEAGQPSEGTCGGICQPGTHEGKQSQLSSSASTHGKAGVQGLPKGESVGSSSKQLASRGPGTSGLSKSQKCNRRKKFQSCTKASNSNVPWQSASRTKRPMSSDSTPSPGLEVLQKKPRKDLQPGSFAEAIKTTKIAIVRDSFPTNKLTSENSVHIQRAILERMDSVLSDKLSFKIYDIVLWDGALIVHCGDATTVDWIRNCLNGDREVLGGEALKVMSVNELPKPCKVAFRTRNAFTTDPSILLKRLQRLNKGLITEHWKFLHVSFVRNRSRWIFEVDESDVDIIRAFNLRAFSGLDYGVFKILYDPRDEKKVEEGKLPGYDPSKVTTSELATFEEFSSPEFEDLDLDSESEAISHSIPGLTLLDGGD